MTTIQLIHTILDRVLLPYHKLSNVKDIKAIESPLTVSHASTVKTKRSLRPQTGSKSLNGSSKQNDSDDSQWRRGQQVAMMDDKTGPSKNSINRLTVLETDLSIRCLSLRLLGDVIAVKSSLSYMDHWALFTTESNTMESSIVQSLNLIVYSNSNGNSLDPLTSSQTIDRSAFRSVLLSAIFSSYPILQVSLASYSIPPSD